MQASLDNIWRVVQGLSRPEKIKLMEKLVHQLRIENGEREESVSWEEMYGIGRGIWNVDSRCSESFAGGKALTQDNATL